MLRATERIARVAAMAGGAALLLVAAMVSVEVLVRRFIGITLGGADEVSGYVFAISTSWALSYALIQRAHIRIDLVYERLAGRGRAAMDLLSLMSMAIVAGMVAWYGYGVLARSLELSSKANSLLATPLWVPQALWVLGLALFLWTLCLLLFLTVRAIASGRFQEAALLSGVPSSATEIGAAGPGEG